MRKIHPGDPEVLAGIFFPDHDHLLVLSHDMLMPDPANLPPGRIVLVLVGNCQPPEALYLQAAGVIAFFCSTKRLPGFQYRDFRVVNNHDGSIRWLHPVDCRKPVFLRLYNGSGWGGRLYRAVFQLSFALGLGRLLASGRIRIFFHKRQLLDELLSSLGSPTFGIFTGTVGDNRKAIIAVPSEDSNSQGRFFKLPLTESAKSFIEREHFVLESLRHVSLKKLAVPKASALCGGLLLTDVRPKQYRNEAELWPLHLDALLELHDHTLQHCPLISLPAWDSIRTSLEELATQPPANELNPEVIEAMREELCNLFDAFDPFDLMPTTLAHGDFTPWNMYLAQDRLHVYDWEMSERLPLLYDAFHFIFQTSVLVHQQPFSVIARRVSALRAAPQTRAMLTGQTVKFDQLYRFYLLRNISYYLRKYIAQPHIHQQAFWLLITWREALGALRKGSEVSS